MLLSAGGFETAVHSAKNRMSFDLVSDRRKLLDDGYILLSRLTFMRRDRLRAAVAGAGTSSTSSCFDLVLIVSILIYVDLHFKIRTFGYWLADGKFGREAIGLALRQAHGRCLLLQTLARKTTKQDSSNSSEYLGGEQEGTRNRGGTPQIAATQDCGCA